MNEMKPTRPILAHQAERLYRYRPWYMRKNMRRERGSHFGQRVFRQFARQRHMKAKFIQNVRIPPFFQESVLSGSEASGAPLGQFLRRCGGAEPVKVTNTRGRERRKIRDVAFRDERHKPSQSCELQTVKSYRPEALAMLIEGLGQCFSITVRREAKGRFECGMKPVFSWCRGDVIQRKRQVPQRWRRGAFSSRGIPAEPTRTRLGKGSVLWRVVNTVSPEFHFVSPDQPRCSPCRSDLP